MRILLFGANKLPGLARNMGKSMRIFKTEVEGLKNDSKKDPREKDGEEVVTGGRHRLGARLHARRAALACAGGRALRSRRRLDRRR